MPNKTFPGNYRNLKAISEFIVDQAQEASFSPKEVYAIQTAVDEACANIIDHAYGGENIGNIKVYVSTINNGLRIVLQDEGEPFDPAEVPEPDISSPLEIRKERGLGIFFMRQSMDKVLFEFSQKEGNTLTLIKYKGD
jgi:serine/threonine-protein kinase RsbW